MQNQLPNPSELSNLTIAQAWRVVFDANASVKATDKELTALMTAAFPKSAGKSTVTRVNMWRSLSNRGVEPNFKSPPLTPSVEYGPDGEPLEAQRGTGTVVHRGMTESRVRELCREEMGLRPVVNVTIQQAVGGSLTVSAEGRHAKFVEVLRLVSAGAPVLLVGPTGSGKTHLAGQVAEALGLRFTFNSMSAGVTESSLLGRVLPMDDGRWEYRPAPFVETFEGGGLHLFDEIDAADPNLLVCVNSAIANGLLSVPFAGKVFKRHPSTAIISAANTFGLGADRSFVGRNQLDAATLDRFAASTIVVDYDRELERRIAAAIAGPKGEEVTRWAWRVRDGIIRGGVRRFMSTRTVENAAKMVAAGETVQDVAERYFAGWSREELAKVN